MFNDYIQLEQIKPSKHWVHKWISQNRAQEGYVELVELMKHWEHVEQSKMIKCGTGGAFLTSRTYGTLRACGTVLTITILFLMIISMSSTLDKAQ